MKDIKDNIAYILTKSRIDAGLSQEDISAKIDVSKRTVQYWESGMTIPKVDQAALWFKACNVSPYPYLSAIVTQSVKSDDDQEVTEVLESVTRSLPIESKKQLLYCMTYKHGSSVNGLLQMITAYLHTPLQYRLNVALMILNNYNIAKSTGKMIAPEMISPNIEILRRSLEKAISAVIHGEAYYEDEEQEE